MSERTPTASVIRAWRDHPEKFVWDQFHAEPDKWQLEELKLFADPTVKRISMQACAGPGKSAILAWNALNFLSCYADKGEHPKGAAVSITADNLKDNLWPEIAKWMKRSKYLESMFTWTKERVFCKQHPETWFLAARSWSKTANADEQGRTLSGLHSEFVLALLDESGEIPISVLKAAEQALSNCKWGKIVQAGNPTSLDGVLYAAAKQLRHLWKIVRITGDPDDPDRSPRIDAAWAREQITTYGRDNPWVMSYILGMFPPSSIASLLGPDEVLTAMTRIYRPEQYDLFQKRIGVDVARFGDDRTILFPRQGIKAFNPVEMRNARTNEIADRTYAAKQKWGSELEFVDDTGGWGAGVIDHAILLGMAPIPVGFATKAIDPRYFNKRSEIIWLMAEWVKKVGQLPKRDGLKRELCALKYWFENGKLRIAEKDMIKKELGGQSPDEADALAMTFALPEARATDTTLQRLTGQSQPNLRTDFDPNSADSTYEPRT